MLQDYLECFVKNYKYRIRKTSNADIYLFIEKGMRGGISYINKKYSKANNEYCLDYDKTRPKVYINYIDMNNLYGDAMSEYLPYGGFKWVKITNETVNRISNKSDNSLHGYLSEVDLDYSENLDGYHNDYPMAPEKIKIEDNMLSPYCSKIKKYI